MHPQREVTDLERSLRALVPEIRETAARERRGQHGAALYRSAAHETSEALKRRLDDIFGLR